MVEFNDIQAQLIGLDKHSRNLSVIEVKQLANMLQKEEQIMACLKGWYGGAMSLLCATDQRVIVIDGATTDAHIIAYNEVLDLQKNTSGWMCKFALILHDQKYEFKVWGLKKVHSFHDFMRQHKQYLSKLSNQKNLFNVPLTIQHPGVHANLTARNWRTFVRKMGNTATTS